MIEMGNERIAALTHELGGLKLEKGGGGGVGPVLDPRFLRRRVGLPPVGSRTRGQL
jgi:hypothetical protein